MLLASSTNSLLLSSENLQLQSESLHVSLPDWVKYTRVYSGMLNQNLPLDKLVGFVKEKAFVVAETVAKGEYFLCRPKTGQFKAIFIS